MTIFYDIKETIHIQPEADGPGTASYKYTKWVAIETGSDNEICRGSEDYDDESTATYWYDDYIQESSGESDVIRASFIRTGTEPFKREPHPEARWED